MPQFVWTIPVAGDARRRSPEAWNRGHHGAAATFDPFLTDVRDDAFGAFDYLAQVVRAADASGFDAVYVPYDPSGDEAWAVAAAALRASRYLRVIPEFPAGFATPVYAAKMATTLQRGSAGRLDWSVLVDLDEATSRRHGDVLSGADRFARAEEFLGIARGVLAGGGYDFEGRYYTVDGGGFAAPLGGQPFPIVYTHGTTPAALQFAARYGDVHVIAGAAPETVARRIDDVRAHDRDDRLRIAVTLPVLARQTSEEAVAKARRLVGLAGTPAADPVAGGWAGFRSIGLAHDYGIVGSFEHVASELAALSDVGVDTFILDTPGRLEGAYLLGEELLPLFAGAPVPA